MPDDFETTSREPLDPALAERSVQRFEAALPAPEAGLGPELRAQRLALGPIAVRRTAARATRQSRGLGRAIAEWGARVRVEGSPEREARVHVSGSASGALVCAALLARAERGRGAALAVAGREEHERLDREALAPLVDAGEIVIERGASTERPAPALALVAPYYYAKADLERLAWEIALELAAPSPACEGGIALMLPRGWDQRAALEDRARQIARKLGDEPSAARLEVVTVEASEVGETLAAADEDPRSRDGRALFVFVYPMWRERVAVEATLLALAGRSPLCVVNHRPTLAWQLGVGGSSRRVLVDADQRLRAGTTPRSARRLEGYAKAPSVARAAALALSNWWGL